MGERSLDFYHRRLSSSPDYSITREMLRNAGIGRSYWSVSVKQIPDNCPYKISLQEMIASLPEDVRRGKGVVFYGLHGYGKTSAAEIMLKAAMARGGQCFSRMLSSIEHAYEKRWTETNMDGIEVWDMLTKCQLVTLDDLGHELAAGGYRVGDIRIFEELLRQRIDDRLVSYITTNLPIKELPKQYPSIKSILFDPTRFYMVDVTGHNWRRNKAK